MPKAHYLHDVHSNPVSTARVIDVVYPTSGQTALDGVFVIRVPEEVAVKDPADLTDVLTQKYQGILASFTTSTRIAYDDMLDTSGINIPSSSQLLLGERNNVGLFPGSVLRSSVVTLTGANATQAYLVWELFEVIYSDPATGRATRTYSEIASTPSFVTAEVTFNNNATPFLPISNGNVLNVDPADRGTSFVVRFTNAHATKRLYLASWAVVY